MPPPPSRLPASHVVQYLREQWSGREDLRSYFKGRDANVFLESLNNKSSGRVLVHGHACSVSVSFEKNPLPGRAP